MSDAQNLQADTTTGARPGRADLLMLAAGLTVYLLIVALGYGFSYDFVCRDVLPAALCQGLSLAVPRAMVCAGLLVLLFLARPEIRALHLRVARARLDPLWLAVLCAGLLCTLIPLFAALLQAGALLPVTWVALSWLGGLALTGVGLAGAVYRLGDVSRADISSLAIVAGAVCLGVALPDIALKLQPVWKFDWLTDATFQSVVAILSLLGHGAVTDVETKLIQLDEFWVLVGPQCSGIEGFALITAFLAFYVLLFRSHLNLVRCLLLLPLGLALSWLFNVTRISVLILMGRFVSPDLAINGFHSHAGWLAFVAVSVGLITAAHRIPYFQRDMARPAPSRAMVPLPQDREAALILPFVVFMLSALMASTFSEVPGLLYPVGALAMAGALALFLPVYRSMPWRPDPLAIGCGVVIGALWILTAPQAHDTDTALGAALADLPAALFVTWVVARVIGTSCLVPIIEEGFFRGYVQTRLAGALGETRVAQILAILVSTALFAILHDRWFAAALAGVVFGALLARRGRLSDAIWSHAVANAIIALAALSRGSWHLI